MVTTVPAKEITLHELTDKFGLQLIENDQFFREWQDNIPEITEAEKERLDRVKASYSNLVAYPPLLENKQVLGVLKHLME
ncbi:MAG: hypothetical protein F6J98_22375 [Moorea sp. SIO4G2]|uniref:hypothetical protein n=1 Tax=unclassified Moorena TaxID=2683338 RepID=UPI0013FB5309|nr:MULTISPECIES: hypothetical protein [unclassified Moorena]NEO15033.1 hypothetical protein [Moorena sp. SIO3E8]NEO63034.1 hypothetical protein [Moorena sp. SIO4G2]NEQ01437.1 hypothetical protein [Moorena sp. SIO3F7]